MVNKHACVYGRKRGELRYSAYAQELTNVSRISLPFEMLISTAYRSKQLVPSAVKRPLERVRIDFLVLLAL